ncbi:uncharacterized protein [Temnothorax longispinosus]
MELRAFRLFVTCYLTCILCRNAIGGSTIAKVFPSINNVFEPDVVRMSERGNTQIERSIETETRPDGITLKNDWLKLETPLVEDLSMKMRNLNDFKIAECSRYCIEELGIGKGFEDINLVLSFADQNGEDHFSLENSSNLRISRHVSINDTNSTILDYCQIYLNLDCDIANIERNLVIRNDEFYSNLKLSRQNIEIFKNYFSNTIPKFSKIVHRINLSGYTESNFQTDANVTGIAINILGNLTRAVLITPMYTNRVERPRIVMSLGSTYNTKGVAIGARNLPDKWCLKLTGVENSKYNFDVTAYYGANEEDNMKDDIIDPNFTSEINKNENMYEILDEKRITTQSKESAIINKTKLELNEETLKNTHKNNNSDSLLISSTINGKQKFLFERSAEIVDSRRNNDEIMADDFSDISLSSRESTATIDKNIINFVLHNNSLMSYGEFKILPNVSNINIMKEQKIQSRSSEVASLNEDIDAKMISVSETVPMQIAEKNSDESEFSTINEEPFERRKIMLELNPNSKLIAAPGTTHRIFFDAMNNCALPVRYVIRARSSPFRVYNIQPTYMWLYPRQTNRVAVDILVPLSSQDTVNTLTVEIVGTEISEKTVYVYVQNAFSKTFDTNVKPKIEYSFNSNCAGKQSKDRCEKTFWSADITAEAYDSGLKRVISIPSGIYPRTKYISGTKDRITFYYLSTCCTTTAVITAIDVFENQHTRTINVNEWDNLEQGEIAAIVLGALLLLFLIILLVIAIVYCVRKRNSHDLPYTQRYGSRQPPARSERTSF